LIFSTIGFWGLCVSIGAIQLNPGISKTSSTIAPVNKPQCCMKIQNKGDPMVKACSVRLQYQCDRAWARLISATLDPVCQDNRQPVKLKRAGINPINAKLEFRHFQAVICSKCNCP
jgi:hypothetical protein